MLKKLLLLTAFITITCQAVTPEAETLEQDALEQIFEEAKAPVVQPYAGPPTVKGQIMQKTRRFKRWLNPVRAAALALAIVGAGVGGATLYGQWRAYDDDHQHNPPAYYHWLNPIGWGYQRYRKNHPERPVGKPTYGKRADVEATLLR